MASRAAKSRRFDHTNIDLVRSRASDEHSETAPTRFVDLLEPTARRSRDQLRQKLLHLDDVLRERVVGQDEAVELVADAVIRARSRIKDPRRPIGSFLFLGPTGVGKTELAHALALAAALFDTEENIVRLDMSEYQEPHTAGRRSHDASHLAGLTAQYHKFITVRKFSGRLLLTTGRAGCTLTLRQSRDVRRHGDKAFAGGVGRLS